MPLSKERVGEIEVILRKKFAPAGGIRLNPEKVRRDIFNISKKLGITPQLCAKLVGDIINEICNEVLAETEVICTFGDELENPKE